MSPAKWRAFCLVGGDELKTINPPSVNGISSAVVNTIHLFEYWRAKQVQEHMRNLTRCLQTHPHIALGLSKEFTEFLVKPMVLYYITQFSQF